MSGLINQRHRREKKNEKSEKYNTTKDVFAVNGTHVEDKKDIAHTVLYNHPADDSNNEDFDAA